MVWAEAATGAKQKAAIIARLSTIIKDARFIEILLVLGTCSLCSARMKAHLRFTSLLYRGQRRQVRSQSAGELQPAKIVPVDRPRHEPAKVRISGGGLQYITSAEGCAASQVSEGGFEL